MNLKFTLIEKIIILVTVAIWLYVLKGSFQKTSENVPAKIESAPKELALEISVEEFKAAYNKVALERNVPKLKIDEFEFGTGKDRTIFKHQFIKGFYLFGKIDDETGYIKDLTVTNALTLSGTDRKAQVQATAYVFLMIIQTLAPELSVDERAGIIDKFADSKNFIKVDTDKIEYSQALLEDGKVLMLSATVKEKIPS